MPEVVEAAAEHGTAQSQDGVGARHGPVHAGALEPGADGNLAARFDYGGGGAQPLSFEGGIVQAVPVAFDVGSALASLVMAGGVHGQGRDEGLQLAGIQFVLAGLGPGLAQFRGRPIDRRGDGVELLLGVAAVDDLDRARELLVGQVPDPLPHHRR